MFKNKSDYLPSKLNRHYHMEKMEHICTTFVQLRNRVKCVSKYSFMLNLGLIYFSVLFTIVITINDATTPKPNQIVSACS